MERNYEQQKTYLNEKQTEIKSRGLPRCITIIGFDMKLLNFIIKNYDNLTQGNLQIFSFKNF